jgi:hypothetical protein
VLVARQVNLDEGPNRYLNANFGGTTVPVPKGLGPLGGRVGLSRSPMMTPRAVGASRKHPKDEGRPSMEQNAPFAREVMRFIRIDSDCWKILRRVTLAKASDRNSMLRVDLNNALHR